MEGRGCDVEPADLGGEAPKRCQPLDFAGAIHYDSFGRRLARPPVPPRSASSLSCRGDVDAGYYPAAENGDAV